MKKYEYPKEASEDKIKELVERAKVITKKSSYTFFASFVVSVALLAGIIVYFSPLFRGIHNPTNVAEIALAIAFGVSLFVSAFLIDFVNVFFLRRIFNNSIPYYPSPEEFVFAQCILTATLFDRNPKANWAQAVRNRSLFLSEEFSRFIKYDILNFRRKFYADEFKLLGSGETQIGRMLLFSQGKKKELLTNFALSLVNNNDPEAFKNLKELVNEINEYGKLEDLAQRIENQLKKWKSVVALIGAIVAVVATIVGLIIR